MTTRRKARATRLLIADDDPDTRLSLKLLLERAGYEIELAPNGSQALELQRSRPVDVLITDIFMPETDGLETIESFRRDFPNVAIIAMSGGAGPLIDSAVYLDTAGIAGADAVLRKPFDVKSLLRALRSIRPDRASPPPASR